MRIKKSASSQSNNSLNDSNHSITGLITSLKFYDLNEFKPSSDHRSVPSLSSSPVPSASSLFQKKIDI